MAMSVKYLTVNGEILSETRNGVRADYIPDIQGSTAALINSSGTITDTFTWWPFGELRSHATGSSTTPFGYDGTLGYYSDGDSGRIYDRMNVYRPSLTGWQTVDLLWPSVLAYVYGLGNPITFTDPSGLGPEVIIGFEAVGGAIAVGAGEGSCVPGIGTLIGGGIAAVIALAVLMVRSVPDWRSDEAAKIRRELARMKFPKPPNYRNCKSLYDGCMAVTFLRPSTWDKNQWQNYCAECKWKCQRGGIVMAVIGGGCYFWDILLRQAPTTVDIPLDISPLFGFPTIGRSGR